MVIVGRPSDSFIGLCVCTYICILMYVCVCMCTVCMYHTYACTCTYMHTYVCMYACVYCMYVSYVCMCRRSFLNVNVYVFRRANNDHTLAHRVMFLCWHKNLTTHRYTKRVGKLQSGAMLRTESPDYVCVRRKVTDWSCAGSALRRGALE